MSARPRPLPARRSLATRLSLALALFALPLAGGCSEYAEPTLTPAQQKKIQAHLLTEAPKPQVEVNAVIEDQIRLIGYDLSTTTAKPGEQVTITWYLEALSDPTDDNQIFVHFQGRKNDRAAWMNLDHAPIEGLLPLRRLKKGQIVKDVQQFTVKADFPGGPAHLYWGLWRGDLRLKVKAAGEAKVDGEGRLQVAQITIEGGKAVNKSLAKAAAYRLAEGEKITLDGRLDEALWQRATPTEWWGAPDGSDRAVPRTRARFLWDDDFLYVGVEASDDDVWSTFTERDSNTWEQEVIELFIDAAGSRKNYLELQVTPANVIFDAKFKSHRSDLAEARAWNMAGLRTAVHVDGTLNQRDDVDRGYSIEMAVPIAEVPGAPNPPQVGNSWRVNLFRWDLPKSGRQVASAFSPPIVGDFHALDRFGHLHFVDQAAPAAAPALAPHAPAQAPSAPTQAPSAPVQAPSAPVQAPSAPASKADAATLNLKGKDVYKSGKYIYF